MAKYDVMSHIVNMHLRYNDKSSHHYAISIPSHKSYGWHERIAISTNANYKRGIMPSIHAEADMIKKIGRKRNIPKAIDIIVVRCSKTGNIGESRPCYHCILAMSRSRLNIKNIYYSTNDGTMAKEELCDMVSKLHKSYISTGMKHCSSCVYD